jgi:hypothetical protein
MRATKETTAGLAVFFSLKDAEADGVGHLGDRVA